MERGFTLIEILITLGLSAILFSAGFFITVDAYKSSLFQSEFNLFLQILEKARSRAINNIDGVPVVLKIKEEAYFINEEKYERNQKVTITGPSEITFQNLSGNASPATNFILSDGVRSEVISVEESGRINW